MDSISMFQIMPTILRNILNISAPVYNLSAMKDFYACTSLNKETDTCHFRAFKKDEQLYFLFSIILVYWVPVSCCATVQ